MFETANGARLAAKRIQDQYGIKASTAREVVARAAGYRDHHHLATAMGTPGAPRAPAVPPAGMIAYVAGIKGVDAQTLFDAIIPSSTPTAAGPLDATRLADLHPLTRGYGPLMRAAQDFAGGCFEMWCNEDALGIDVEKPRIGSAGRAATKAFTVCVQDAFLSLFGMEDMPDALHNGQVIRFDDDGLLVEEQPCEPIRGSTAIWPGRRVLIPHRGAPVSEIVLHGVEGMPRDARELNIWRNTCNPCDLDVETVHAVRNDGTFTYYHVEDDDVARMGCMQRDGYDEVVMEPGVDAVRPPDIMHLQLAYCRHELEDEFEHLLGEPGDRGGATRLDVARATAFMRSRGLETPRELEIAWMAYVNGNRPWTSAIEFVSIRQTRDGPTDLESGTGMHGVAIIRDRHAVSDAPPLLAMASNGHWTCSGFDHGPGVEGLREALVDAW